MPDVIKTGQVVIDFVKGKSDVKAPDLSPVVDAKQKEIDLNQRIIDQEQKVKEAAGWAAAAQQASAEKAARAQREAAEEAKRHSDALQQAAAADAAAIEQAAAEKKAAEEEAALAAEKAAAKAAALRKSQLEGANQLAEGLLKVGRAAALASATGSDSIKKLVENIVAAQVAVDIFTGGTTALKGFVAWLGAARIASLGLTASIAALEAVAAPLLLVLAALAAAYVLIARAEEEARQEAQAYREEQERQATANAQAVAAATERERSYQQQLRATMDLRSQSAAIAGADIQEQLRIAEMISAAPGGVGRGAEGDLRQQNVSLATTQNAVNMLNEQQAAERKIAEERAKALDDQASLIQLKQKELEIAEEVLKTEEKKTEAFLSQFGALSKGEQERLKRIDKKINAGEELSRSELNALGKAGGLAAEAAARIYADRGRKAGGEELLFGGKNAAAKALEDVQNAAGALSEVTGGLAADAALRAIKDRKAEVEKEFAAFLQSNLSALRAALNQMAVISERIKKVEVGLAYSKQK